MAIRRGLSGLRRPTGALRIGVVAVSMVLVAEGAAWLLRPRERPIQPAPVPEGRYFTTAQITRGRSFSEGQLWLFAAALGAQGAVLVTLALGRPGAVRRRLEVLGARPVLGAALAGAGLSVTLGVAALPAGIAAHQRAVDYGISTQTLGSWLGDVGKSATIGAALAAAGGALLMALVRRFGGRWWLPATVAVAAIATVFVWLAPVVLAPIFNKFTPLPANSRARADVLGLARRAGVEVGQVYRVDASRRVRSLNAYVDGLGSTKRVVLYDNLLRRTNRPELESVVAHELGHVKHEDVLRGLTFLVIVAPLGLLFAAELGAALAGRAELEPRGPAALPAYFLGLAVAALILGVVGNQLSRRVEASADAYALQLTHDPRALIEVQRRLALSSVSDPDPPGLVTALIGTHPSTMDRIGAAVAYQREH
ncbi:MAG TPA: M48 family metalloprotease [Solirubrobacterales bacterium]